MTDLPPWLQRLNFTIWQYAQETTAETLLRHHVIARWIIRVCTYACVGLVSTMALGLIFGFSFLDRVLLLVFCIVGLSLMIPAIFCILWLSDIEKELKKRNQLVPRGRSSEEEIRKWAFRMMLWAAIIILVGLFLKKR